MPRKARSEDQLGSAEEQAVVEAAAETHGAEGAVPEVVAAADPDPATLPEPVAEPAATQITDVRDTVSADHVEINQGGARLVQAREVAINQGGANTVRGENVSVNQGGAMLVQGRRVELRNSGAFAVAGSEVHGENSSAFVVIARNASGIRPLIDWRGVAAAVGVVMLVRMLRRGRR